MVLFGIDDKGVVGRLVVADEGNGQEVVFEFDVAPLPGSGIDLFAGAADGVAKAFELIGEDFEVPKAVVVGKVADRIGHIVAGTKNGGELVIGRSLADRQLEG